jgi:hypothetical protein
VVTDSFALERRRLPPTQTSELPPSGQGISSRQQTGAFSGAQSESTCGGPHGPDPPTEQAAKPTRWDDEGSGIYWWCTTSTNFCLRCSFVVVFYLAFPIALNGEAGDTKDKLMDRLKVFAAGVTILLMLLEDPRDIHPIVLNAAGLGYAHNCVITSPKVEAKKEVMDRSVAWVGLYGTAMALAAFQEDYVKNILVAMYVNGLLVMIHYDFLYSLLGWRFLPALSANCFVWLAAWPELIMPVAPGPGQFAADTMHIVALLSLCAATMRGVNCFVSLLGFVPTLPAWAEGLIPDLVAHACGYNTNNGSGANHSASDASPEFTRSFFRPSTQAHPPTGKLESQPSSGPRPPSTPAPTLSSS